MFDLKKWLSLSHFFDALGFTHDSAVWFIGKFTSLVLFLASLNGDQLAQYGVPHSFDKVISVLALWIMYFSAQNSGSPLTPKQ